MTNAALDRALTGKHVPTVAALVSLALGLVFIFVWAPHPWGWFGIDQYHQIAVDLSHGKPFPTLDVPWGYGYFLAAFYRLFGPTPAPALVAQALLNALIPVLVYRVAAREFDVRVAAVAAVLVSVLSFNTVYASTEASDAVCTFLFMLMLWAFVEARRQRPVDVVRLGRRAAGPGSPVQAQPPVVADRARGVPRADASAHVAPRARRGATWRDGRVDGGAVDAAQLSAHWRDHSDEHPWWRAAVVRLPRDRAVPDQPRPQSPPVVRDAAVRLHEPHRAIGPLRRLDDLRARRARRGGARVSHG